jgi:hypothetical protein
MRGGFVRGFGSRETTCQRELALPPLTLTLSPLRGEGTRRASQVRKSLASLMRLDAHLDFGIWNFFEIWSLEFGALNQNSFSHSTRSSLNITEPF